MVTADELAYVRKYFNAAAMVANDAMAAAAALTGAINGWDDVVARAKNAADFTRAAAWDSVTRLRSAVPERGRQLCAFLVERGIARPGWSPWLV